MPERTGLVLAILVLLALVALALRAFKRSKTKQTGEILGVEMTLDRETRWSRHYYNRELRQRHLVSRFMDGSAAITLADLQKEWPSWGEEERLDFCQSISFADKGVLRDILRFIMANGTFSDWRACALSIAGHVPPEESVPFLVRVSSECTPGEAANLLQALAHTKSPNAAPVIMARLGMLWTSNDLLLNGGWANMVAFEAVCCIQYLLELSEPPEAYREHYEAMLRHPNERNRKTTHRYLGKFFEETSE
jgi:hypothetical protein